jgi:HlyD family secretion protein
VPVIAGALALVVIAAILTFTGVLANVRQMIPGLADTTPVYQTTGISKGNVSVSVTATGPIAAPEDIPLTFKESGKLASVKVQIGDQVKQGQVLATLDTTDLQTSLNQAKAQLATAQAALEKLQAGATDAQKQVAQTSIDNAKSSATDSTTSLATTQDTVKKDTSVAAASVTSAQTALATAQSSLAAAQQQETSGLAADQAAIDSAQKNLDAVNASVAANLPVLEQAVEKAKDDLYSSQVSRDGTCARPGTSCNAANASVAGAQTAVNSASAALVSGQKQGQQSITSAQSQLDTAKTNLANDKTKLDAAVVSAQNAVKQAQSALASAQASYDDTQAKSSATVQSAQAQVNTAQANIKTAQANYNQTVAPPTKADLDSAQAQVDSAQAAVDTAQSNLNGATLTAPADGTIAAINVYVGQWISGGPIGAVGSATTATMVLVNLNNLQVTAAVNEADIGKVKVGDPVTFDVAAFPNETFDGKVLDIQPIGTTTQNVVNYNVTSGISSNKNQLLYPGMTATVTITSAEHDNVLEVPNTAFNFAQAAVRQGLVQFNRGNGTPRATGTPGANQRPAGTGNGQGQGQRTGGNGGNGGQGQGANGQGGGQFGQGSGGQGGNGQGGGRQFGQGNRNIVVVMKAGQLTLVPVTTGLTDGTVTEIVSGLTGDEQIVVGPIGRTTSSTGTNGQTGGQGGARPVGGPGGGAFFGGP